MHAYVYIGRRKYSVGFCMYNHPKINRSLHKHTEKSSNAIKQTADPIKGLSFQ